MKQPTTTTTSSLLSSGKQTTTTKPSHHHHSSKLTAAGAISTGSSPRLVGRTTTGSTSTSSGTPKPFASSTTGTLATCTTSPTTTTITTCCATAKKCVNLCEAYGVVCPWAALVAARTTQKTVQELFVGSRLFTHHDDISFTQFAPHQITLGPKLGEGGFSIVSQCTVTTTTTKPQETEDSGKDTGVAANEKEEEEEEEEKREESDDLEDDVDSHSATTTTTTATTTKTLELAIKYLRRRAMVDYHHFKHGAADLAVEAYFLQTLSHRNIIQLHGIAAGSMQANILSRNGGLGGCFLVLDRLVETLEQRIDGWKKQDVTAPLLAPSSANHHNKHHRTTAASNTTNTLNLKGPFTARSINQQQQQLTTTPRIRRPGSTWMSTWTMSLATMWSNMIRNTASNVVWARRRSSPAAASSSGFCIQGATTNNNNNNNNHLATTAATTTAFSFWMKRRGGLPHRRRRRPAGGTAGTGTRVVTSLFGAATWTRQAKRAQLRERLEIALEVAHAMAYLHSLSVMFRDLKPSNIGFNTEGTLKLFDFGLAKEIKGPPGTYRLTGHTGSRRYMAPEVAKGSSDYDLSVDVYGFGIMLWELCCAQKPFYGYSSNKHTQLVVLGGERPKMEHANTRYWPAELQTLMKNCWSALPPQRPPFSQIVVELQQIIQALQGDVPTTTATTTTTTTSASPESTAVCEGSVEDTKDVATADTRAATGGAASTTRSKTSSSSSWGFPWDNNNNKTPSKATGSSSVPSSPCQGDKKDGEEQQEGDKDDDLSMKRTRRFSFFPRLALFQRSDSFSSPRGRSRSRSTDGRQRQRGLSWGSWKTRSRSTSNDSVRSEQRRRQRQHSSRRNLFWNSSRDDHPEPTPSSARANEDTNDGTGPANPPALLSGTSVIQVLTEAAAEQSSSSQAFLLGTSGDGDARSGRSITASSAPSSSLVMMSKHSEASVVKEHETTTTTANTTSSRSGDDLDLSFHSAVMEVNSSDDEQVSFPSSRKMTVR